MSENLPKSLPPITRLAGRAVHPLAALFPMLPDDELADLASDIRERGLLHPIIVDRDGAIVDGRNRAAACELAGVEPTVEPVPDGVEPAAVIYSANLARRHMSKSQRAMATAMLYPEPQKGGRGNKGVSNSQDYDRSLVSRARTVLAYSRPLALAVLAGTKPLDEALADVRRVHEQQSSTDAKLDRLRTGAPDLFDLVGEERMHVDEAIAAMREREERVRQITEAGRRSAARLAELPGEIVNIAAAIRAGASDVLTSEIVRLVVAAGDDLDQALKEQDARLP